LTLYGIPLRQNFQKHKTGKPFMPLSLKHPLAFSLVFVFQQLGFPTFNFFSSIFLLLPLSSFFFLPSFFLLPPTPSISSHNPILSLTHIDMSRNSSPRPSDFLSFSASLSLLFVSALSDDSSKKDSTHSGNHPSSRSSTGSMVAIILLGILVVVLLSFFLFKLWQKKRREEQYARLLKLFEEDDELEVELGLRD
ncbi:hypothetical protein Csa_011006, partial [Cucumis sativus]